MAISPPKTNMKRLEESIVEKTDEEPEDNDRRAKRTRKTSTSFVYKHSYGSIELHSDSLECLNNALYINDSVIEFYLAYLLNEVCPKSLVSRVHIFDTIFFKELDQAFNTPERRDSIQSSSSTNEKNIQPDKCDDLKKWFKDVDIFKKDFLVIPICTDNHWQAILVFYPDKVEPVFINNDIKKTSSILLDVTNSNTSEKKLSPAIVVLDSLRLETQRLTGKVRDFLDYEWRRKNATFFQSVKRFSNNDLKEYYPKIPKQKNAYDCGLYMLMYIRSFIETPETFYKLAQSDDPDSTKTLRTMISKSLDVNDRNSIKDLISRVCVKNS